MPISSRRSTTSHLIQVPSLRSSQCGWVLIDVVVVRVACGWACTRGRWLLQPLVREADILGRQAIVALLVDKRGLATSLAAVRAWTHDTLLLIPALTHRDVPALSSCLWQDYGRSSRGEASFARGSLDLERTAQVGRHFYHSPVFTMSWRAARQGLSSLSTEVLGRVFWYAVVSDRTQRFLSSKAKSRATLQDLLDTYTATLTLDKLSKTLRQHLRQEGAEGQEGEAALEEKLAKPLEKVAGTTGAQRLLGWRGTVG